MDVIVPAVRESASLSTRDAGAYVHETTAGWISRYNPCFRAHEPVDKLGLFVDKEKQRGDRHQSFLNTKIFVKKERINFPSFKAFWELFQIFTPLIIIIINIFKRRILLTQVTLRV
jgi:hypothetical protein